MQRPSHSNSTRGRLAASAALAALAALAACGGSATDDAPQAGPEAAAPESGAADGGPPPAEESLAPDDSFADLGPPAQWLTAAGSTAGEPSACVDAAGRLWVTWLAWRDGGPTLEVTCHRRRADGWEQIVSERVAPTDVGLGFAHVAPVGEGAFVAYETRAGGDHRVVGRALSLEGDQVTVGAIEPIAADGLAPRLAALPDGSLVAVWQALAGDAYDVFWRRRGPEGAWSAEPVSTGTPFDEWHPRIAAAADGSVWLTYDAFVDGSFDVFCAGPLGAPDEARHRIAGGPHYEAYADVAVDGDGRPWIAYEQTVDFGRGGALRERRSVALVRLEPDGTVRAADLPDELVDDGQFPRLAAGGDGLLLTARRVDPAFQPREGRRSQNAAGIHHSWTTWTARFDDGAWALEAIGATLGDNEETVELVATDEGLVATLASDDRRRAFDDVTEWNDPIERQWRVGVVDLGAPGGRPPLGAATATPPLPAGDAAPWSGTDGPWLFGDLHRHTQLSRCAGPSDGTTVDNYRYARGPGALDFVSVNDHIQHLTVWSWWRSLRDVDRFHAPPRLVVLPGIERNVKGQGHQNLVYVDRATAEGDEHAWSLAVETPTAALPPAVAAIPHMMSSAFNRFLAATLDPTVQPVLELYQSTRGSYEGPTSPYVARDLHAEAPHVQHFLERAGRLGFIASSDHGETADGVAVLYGAERTRAGVLAALYDRRTAAASTRAGARVTVGDVAGGQAGPIDRGAAVRVDLGPSPAPVAAVELLVNGVVAARRDGGREATGELLVVSSQYRQATEDFPLGIALSGGRIVSIRLRRGERTGVGARIVDATSVDLWTDRQRVELVLEVEWTEGPKRLTVRYGEVRERVGLRFLQPGECYRLAQMPSRHETVWRIGPPLGDVGDAVTFEGLELAPGDAVYARLAYRDGNVLWTSPARVTELRD